MNVQLAPQPVSLSNIGRQSDALKSTNTHKHVHKAKIVLQPWDGLELVDNILAEGQRTGAGSQKGKNSNGREAMVMSSPRVNPVLHDKVIAESTHSQTSHFLKATASALQNLPAMIALKESERRGGSSSDEDDKDFKESRKGKGKRKLKKVHPSPCFLVPPRRGLAEEARAPAVGKYFPRYGFVERRSATPVLPPKTHAKRSHDDSNSGNEEQASTIHSRTWGGESSMQGSMTLDRNASLMSPAGNRASTPSGRPGTGNGTAELSQQAQSTITTGYAKHAVRDCSSSFKSKAKRTEYVATNDLVYWPIPFDGSFNARTGKIIGNARERAYTPFGAPCGAKVDYTVHDERPASSLNLSRVAPRDKVKTRMMFPTEDTSQLAYQGNINILSTKPRLGGHYDMKTQSRRPDPPPPSDATELDPYHDSMLTSPKRGFVDIRRMMTHASEYAVADEGHSPQQLHPNYDAVLTNAPRVAFPRTERMSPVRTEQNAKSYHPDDSSIRRHRPACFMPRTERDTFNVKAARLHDESYNVEVKDHVTTTSFVKQISREVRDKRFEHD